MLMISIFCLISLKMEVRRLTLVFCSRARPLCLARQTLLMYCFHLVKFRNLMHSWWNYLAFLRFSTYLLFILLSSLFSSRNWHHLKKNLVLIFTSWIKQLLPLISPCLSTLRTLHPSSTQSLAHSSKTASASWPAPNSTAFSSQIAIYFRPPLFSWVSCWWRDSIMRWLVFWVCIRTGGRSRGSSPWGEPGVLGGSAVWWPQWECACWFHQGGEQGCFWCRWRLNMMVVTYSGGLLWCRLYIR